MSKAIQLKSSSSDVMKQSYNGSVPVSRILALLFKGGVVIGQQKAAKTKHTKPKSLDYWLREFGESRDTKQADKDFIDDLVKTGLFTRAKVICPTTGRLCKGIELTPAGRKRAEMENRSQ